MDKRRAIQIMTKAAELYRDNLEDQKILFLYAVPSAIKEQLGTEGKVLSSMQGYEVAFHRGNFLHLTGVKLNTHNTASSIHLIELKNKINTQKMKEPSFLMILTGTDFAYKREDGVLVVPIGCLRD